MSYSYTHAKTLLSEVEKDRIVCTFLNSNDPNAMDWKKATDEYGAASVDSYKKGMQNTLKKIKQAMESGVEPEAEETAPVKKGVGGRKRKEKTVETEGEGEEAAPVKKKKGGRKTKAQKEAEAVAAADDEGDAVKTEESE